MPKHPPDCPTWEYSTNPARAAVLPPRANALLVEIACGNFDPTTTLKDTRPIHKGLFEDLTPPGFDYFAGNYRGAKFKCLRYCPIAVSDATGRVFLKGVDPWCVDYHCDRLGHLIVDAIDALTKNNARQELTEEQKATSTIEIACKIAAELMRIHPYANGNGHIGRVCLLAILGRFGYFPKRLPIEPRPNVPGYEKAIFDHQHGNVSTFHKYIFACMN